jgi:hypothetical protein
MDQKSISYWLLLLSSLLLYNCLQAGKICISQTCTYELNITLFKTMTYRDEYLILRQAYFNGAQLQVNVAGQVRDLKPDDVIIADGFTRDIVMVNGRFPGPTIEVKEGVKV